MGMSETVKGIQARARELAISGKFAGWRALAFELQFEPAFFDALEWLYSPSTKGEFDGLYKVAIKPQIRCTSASERCRPKWPKGSGNDVRHLNATSMELGTENPRRRSTRESAPIFARYM